MELHGWTKRDCFSINHVQCWELDNSWLCKYLNIWKMISRLWNLTVPRVIVTPLAITMNHVSYTDTGGLHTPLPQQNPTLDYISRMACGGWKIDTPETYLLLTVSKHVCFFLSASMHIYVLNVRNIQRERPTTISLLVPLLLKKLYQFISYAVALQ